MNTPSPGSDIERLFQDYRELFDELSRKSEGLSELWSQQAGPVSTLGDEEASPAIAALSELPPLPEIGAAVLSVQQKILETCEWLMKTRQGIEEMARDRSSLQAELARFTEQVMVVGRAAAEASEAKTKVQEQLGQKEKELLQKEQEKNRAVEHAGTLEEQTLRLEKDLKTLVHDLADQKVKEEEKSKELEEFRASLKLREEEKTREFEELQKKLRSLEEERDRLAEKAQAAAPLEDELKSVLDSREELQGFVRNLEEENERAREELKTLQSTGDEKAGALASAQEKNLELEARVRELEKALPSNEDIEQTRIEREALEDERDALVEQGKGQLTRILELEEMARAVNTARGDEASLQKRLAEVESELETLRATKEQPPVAEEKRPDKKDGETEAEASAKSALPQTLTQTEWEEEAFLQDEPTHSSRVLRDMDLSDAEAPDPVSLDEALEDSIQPEETPEEAPAEAAEEEPAADTIGEGFDDLDLFETPNPEPGEEPSDKPVPAGFPSPSPDEASSGDGDESSATDSTDMEPAEDSDVDPALFPYPEITGAGMDRFDGKRVLLVGGDERFEPDYRQMFKKVKSKLTYFANIRKLEKNGAKRHVRENDLVVVFGPSAEDPGVFRLKGLTEEYGRLCVEHKNSGLVSLYHQLQKVNPDL